MLKHPFQRLALHNRLGQPVNLMACHIHHQGRDLVFLQAPEQNFHFIGKNAETLAFQLRELYALDARRFDRIELRQGEQLSDVYRWRFEWVGHSPLSARAEQLSEGQAKFMLSLLAPAEVAAIA